MSKVTDCRIFIGVAQTCFASQMVRMVRCLDEIKKEFKDQIFLVDGQEETAGSLLTTGRWFKCILSLELPCLLG